MQDHRKLGRELELFHSDPIIGAGLPLWLPKGAAARRAVEDYLLGLERRHGYQHVYSPPLAKEEMYRRSGHLPHYADDMFPPMALSESDRFVLRPSLCPHHAAVFAARGRSYRELPLRIGEIGGQYRAERSGVLGGLSRVRAISLNDGHVFCAEDQVEAEVVAALEVMREAHAALGFEPSAWRLSLRGDGPKYVDDPGLWERGTAVLRRALEAVGLKRDVDYVDGPGEAAFYGPKIDIQLLDSAGRESTLATVQVDYYMPARFDLSYVDADGVRKRPVMVHRSAAGSMERLFAHLIEVHDGAFPAWYAPVQLEVLPIGDADVRDFVQRARALDLRVEEAHAGSLSARIRGASARRVPFVAVIGASEAAAGTVSLRSRGGAVDVLPVADALARLESQCAVPKRITCATPSITM
ncbi:threonine--tRNA ligase [Dactylosporangium matsuzakiense]|uniref:Threonine--tRNA ligase n=1 Tax=Dactylosporangium matsuzakiense TaxID=53360 RepID=A0A9W6KH31_9ACTN|nr:threonine--tRNA ligase [Dactylosporangium matsuzakiense]UWZ45758.1 threonine--tRNA ligase [Dactylosporangium matsuzakiense]GLK99944.1 threonine--tRNA ligase [Dactylosporangium matsuzakiense]